VCGQRYLFFASIMEEEGEFVDLRVGERFAYIYEGKLI
jgi:hypothetical protein